MKRINRFLIRTLAPAALAIGLMATAGCSTSQGSGKLTMVSQSQRGSTLRGEFSHGVYRYDDNNQLTILLMDGPEDSFQQAVTVRMFWKPRAGRTPIDRTATNATIHYIIFTGEGRQEVGIYSGAGFLFPKGKPGDKSLSAEVWHSTLRLSDATGQFQDLLGPATLKGDVSLRHDDVELERRLRLLNVDLRKTFGFPRLVDARDAQQPSAVVSN